MGRSSRVDQIPMLDDDEVHISRSMELAQIVSPRASPRASPRELALQIDNHDIETDLYGATGASVGKSGEQETDFGKFEHLLKSGPMGKCDDPFCSTCPSYFDYSSQATHLKTGHHLKWPRFSERRANYFRDSAATWWRRCLPGIFNPHTKVVQRWNKVFCISSLIAIFVDPVFFLLLSVREDNICLVFNNTAAVAVTVIRTFTDFMHVLHICLQFRLAYVVSASKVRGAGELEDDPWKIAKHYAKTWFALDLFTALPLPQVLIWTVVKKQLGRESGANYAKNVLRVVVLIQNVPRSIRFFPLLIGRSYGGFVFETAWSSFVINLLMYSLAGHIVGCCWYLFGLQRVNQCLQNVCSNESTPFSFPNVTDTIVCHKNYLDCGDSLNGLSPIETVNYTRWKTYTSAKTFCFTGDSSFNYGIYKLGVPVVLEKRTLYKYIYSLFWGFQQISTLAGNQEPSTFPWEVIFTMGIVALGLLLFALLIGNMQNFLQALGRRKLDMQLRRYDTEEWMKHRRLPITLRRRVRQAGRYRWRLTGGVEERELLTDLPEDLQKDIQRYLCLELVKKVCLFELLEDHVLDGICERLYQKLYIEESQIFTAKRPVERMLFIVRGKLQSYGEDGSTVILKEGDFCGEELLSYYLDVAGVSTHLTHGPKIKAKHKRGRSPLSTRTVTCLTGVEAFCLDAMGLEYVTTHYKSAFQAPRVQGVIRYLSPHWRSMAAIRIQKAWRAYRQRKNQPRRRITSDPSFNTWTNF